MLYAIADQGTSSEYTTVSEIFGLCTVPSSSNDIYDLVNVLSGAFSMMAMVDYPYPSSFITPMPAWPVTASCEAASAQMTEHESDEDAVLYAMAAAGTVYYNYTGQIDCLDTSVNQDGGIDQNGWNILYCNEIAQPFASDSSTSMFPEAAWDKEANTEYCLSAYGENP